jgi:hypothetical protein
MVGWILTGRWHEKVAVTAPVWDSVGCRAVPELNLMARRRVDLRECQYYADLACGRDACMDLHRELDVRSQVLSNLHAAHCRS